jgi:hypothetical protein
MSETIKSGFFNSHATFPATAPQTKGRTVNEVFIKVTAWCRFPFEELTVAQLDDKLPPFMKL